MSAMRRRRQPESSLRLRRRSPDLGEDNGRGVRMRDLLIVVPSSWGECCRAALAEVAPHLRVLLHDSDAYRAPKIDYVLTFRPPEGLLKSLPNLRVVFSLGAGVDGILSDPDYPAGVPLVRFVDHTLSREMAQYCVMHVLMHYRMQRFFDRAQAEH